ncbi:uncharacterized protein LOC142325776 [Lycorma delicatula]|uniref:uncharacterized protein LOC142325776 n=1 Tax=Lycorma delicatula TaxID=130591 RepID=UPI003F513ED1
MYKLLMFIFIMFFIHMSSEYVSDNSSGSGINSEELFETHQTICQINSVQLAATAKATVTRALKGVCLSKSMDDYFKKLEKLFKNQLDVIKEIEIKVDSLASQKLGSSIPHSPEHLVISTPVSWEEFTEKIDEVEIKPNPREVEIKQYNGTVYQEGNGKQIYTYFWKLQNIKTKLLSRKSIRSSNIYITPGGYCMYIRLLTTQNADTVYIQVGLTQGKYDETLLWPFRLKHKLSVLDQVSVNYIDIHSRIWDPTVLCSELHWQKPSSKSDNFECLGLGISEDVLQTRSYITFDTIIIKLTVYLE